jgi:hypothetical protein
VVQVVVTPGKKGKVTTEEMSLVEVGPRVCLQPIKIFAGSFGGPVLYENPGYVSPNKVCGTLSRKHSLSSSADVHIVSSPARICLWAWARHRAVFSEVNCMHAADIHCCAQRQY